MTTVGNHIQNQKRNFEKALKSNLYSDEQKKVFKDAISSLEYISAFYERKYVLPELETDASSKWGEIHGWLMGSYVNVYKAQAILDGKEQPTTQLSCKPSGRCNCDDCKLAMQNKSLRIAISQLKTARFSCDVKYILNSILVVLLRYKCESAAFLVNRTKDVKNLMWDFDGILGGREVYEEERMNLNMLIEEFEHFLD